MRRHARRPYAVQEPPGYTGRGRAKRIPGADDKRAAGAEEYFVLRVLLHPTNGSTISGGRTDVTTRPAQLTYIRRRLS